MALRTDLTDQTVAATVHADQHNEVNEAVLTLQTQVAALMAGGGGGGGGTAPVITTQPTNQSAIAGSNATFTTAATGSPTPTVQWYLSTNGGTSFSPISGGTSYSLVITSTTVGENGYQYHATLTNATGTVTTNTVTLNVGASTVAPSITVQPINHTVTSGQDVTFTAGANGTPAPTVQWQVSTNSGSTWTNISGATSNSYDAGNATTGMNLNEYRAVYTNSAGSATSNAVILTVNAASGAPTLTQQPVNQSVVSGNPVTFTAHATGTPTPTVQWFSSTDGVTFTTIAGATSDSYTIPSAGSGQSGNRFHAVYTNTAGSTQTNNVVLTVVVYNLETSQQAAPNSTGYGWTQNLAAGDGGLIVAVGSNPAGLITSVISDNNVVYTKVASYQEGDRTVEMWLYNSLAGGDGSTWDTGFVAGTTLGSTNVFAYQFNGVLSNPTHYTGDTSIGPFTVPQNSLVMLGAGTDTGSPSLPAGFTAGPTPTLSTTGSAWRIVAPTEPETLVVNAIAAMATVFAIGLPIVLATPLPCTVSAGSTATFACTAVGTPVPTCQWQQSTDGGSNWANVSGAISPVLLLPSVTTGMSGYQYRAIFTNASGSVTSGATTLTVVPTSTGGAGTVTLVDQSGTNSGSSRNPSTTTFSPSVGDSIVAVFYAPNATNPRVMDSVTASNGDTFVRVGTYDPNPSGTSGVEEVWYCGSSGGGSGVTYTAHTSQFVDFNYGVINWFLHFSGPLSHPYFTYGNGSVVPFTPPANSLVVTLVTSPFNWPIGAPFVSAPTGGQGGNLAYAIYATSPGVITINQQGGTEIAVGFQTH